MAAPAAPKRRRRQRSDKGVKRVIPQLSTPPPMEGTTIREGMRLPAKERAEIEDFAVMCLNDPNWDYKVAAKKDRSDVGDSNDSVDALTRSGPKENRWEVIEEEWSGDRRQSLLRRSKEVGRRLAAAQEAKNPIPSHPNLDMRSVSAMGGRGSFLFQERNAVSDEQIYKDLPTESQLEQARESAAETLGRDPTYLETLLDKAGTSGGTIDMAELDN